MLGSGRTPRVGSPDEISAKDLNLRQVISVCRRTYPYGLQMKRPFCVEDLTIRYDAVTAVNRCTFRSRRG